MRDRLRGRRTRWQQGRRYLTLEEEEERRHRRRTRLSNLPRRSTVNNVPNLLSSTLPSTSPTLQLTTSRLSTPPLPLPRPLRLRTRTPIRWLLPKLRQRTPTNSSRITTAMRSRGYWRRCRMRVRSGHGMKRSSGREDKGIRFRARGRRGTAQEEQDRRSSSTIQGSNKRILPRRLFPRPLLLSISSQLEDLRPNLSDNPPFPTSSPTSPAPLLLPITIPSPRQLQSRTLNLSRGNTRPSQRCSPSSSPPRSTLPLQLPSQPLHRTSSPTSSP